MKPLCASKITRGRRISLGRNVLKALNADEGDYVQIYVNDGRVYMATITPPECEGDDIDD